MWCTRSASVLYASGLHIIVVNKECRKSEKCEKCEEGKEEMIVPQGFVRSAAGSNPHFLIQQGIDVWNERGPKIGSKNMPRSNQKFLIIENIIKPPF
jgi:hypothetical protein